MSYQLSGFDPLAFAATLQAGANNVAREINRITGQIQTVQQKANTILDQTTRAANVAGEVAKASTRAGIATAATGDASSGLTTAALTSKPVLIVLAGGLGLWLLTNRGGRGSRRNW